MLEKAENQLRVASYNLSCMSQQSKSVAQARLLVEEEIDIAGLQEINWRNHRFSGTCYNTLDYFDSFPNHAFGEASPFGGGGYGNAIVSQLPFQQMDNWHYDNGKLGKVHEAELISAYANINASQPETVQYRNDLFDQYGLAMIEPRAYQRTLLSVAHQLIAFYNTHLSFESAELRRSQMKQLRRAVLADSTPYKIITGDFNADLNTTDWQIFQPELVLANGYHGVWRDTFIGIDPAVQVNSIDNIIVSPNIKINKVWTIQSTASDHLPLVDDLELKK